MEEKDYSIEEIKNILKATNLLGDLLDKMNAIGEKVPDMASLLSRLEQIEATQKTLLESFNKLNEQYETVMKLNDRFLKSNVKLAKENIELKTKGSDAPIAPEAKEAKPIKESEKKETKTETTEKQVEDKPVEPGKGKKGKIANGLSEDEIKYWADEFYRTRRRLVFCKDDVGKTASCSDADAEKIIDYLASTDRLMPGSRTVLKRGNKK